MGQPDYERIETESGMFSARRISDSLWEIFDEDGDFLDSIKRKDLTPEDLSLYEHAWCDGYLNGKFDGIGIGQVRAMRVERRNLDDHGTDRRELRNAGSS